MQITDYHAQREFEKRARWVRCMLGFPLDLVTMNDVLGEIHNAPRTRQRKFISTINLNFVTQAQSDERFRDSLRCSNLCVADGIAVMLIGRLLGIPVPERVAGSDIVSAIWKEPTSPQDLPLKVFFFGGTEEAGRLACEAVNQHPSKRIVCVGSLFPGYGSVEDMSGKPILEKINSEKPHFLIVSLGARKGQAWIMQNMSKLDVPVISHLGATINFLAGTVRRAPIMWRRLGLEWLWRISEEPTLARRYWKDALLLLWLLITKVLPLSIWFRWNRWLNNHCRISINWKASTSGKISLKLSGALTAENRAILTAELSNQNLVGKTLSIDCCNLKWIDTAGMGSLLMLSSFLDCSNGKLELCGLSRLMKWALNTNGLRELTAPPL